MRPLEIARNALRGITANPLRTGLTTLGVVIGVASVIATLALGNGARASVAASFRFLGADAVQIDTLRTVKEGEFVPLGKNLSYQDGLEMPGAAPLVARVEMAVQASAKVRQGRAVVDLGVSGVTADALTGVAQNADLQPVGWPAGRALTPAAFIGQGRFFTPAEVLGAAPVCVLGYQTALDLFAGDDPLEQTIWVGRQRCLVVGVLAQLETTDLAQRYRSEPNRALYLPISTAIQTLYDEEPAVMITAHVNDESRMNEAKAQIAAYLRRRHAIVAPADGTPPEDDFTLTTREDILGAQQESARAFAFLLMAMAAVSLTVGGIGIMNVMLVSVTERTREIGVRLAVGARARDVAAQFLCEALLLSALGGLLGVAAGVLAVPLAAQLNRGVALLAPDSIPLAFGVALLTGLVFGVYPALRAARLDPIEALRYE
jgi:putative ABC transport system permease protein